STIDSRLRIYKRSVSGRKDDLLDFPVTFSESKPAITEIQNTIKVPENLQTLTDQLLLQQFSPASVLVTDKGDILYITGSTGKYLEPAAGKANMNIFAMARGGLNNELPVAFRRALQNYDKVHLHNIKIIAESGIQIADVTIQQIEKPLALRGKLLVVFTDVKGIKVKSAKRRTGSTGESQLLDELKAEVQRVKEELQGTNEEMQTSQEELKSANEELQSTNEELQSTNEELTTSKEEMQSMNEELQTVNMELQSKIDDFARVNNDMNNLLNSIEIATLFLDKELKIRQYTVHATRIFKLIPGDIGRLFTDQVSTLNYPEIYADANEVLRTLMFVEKMVSTHDGHWFNVRIMPYRTFDDKIDGLVITFIDITKSRILEHSLKKSQLMQLAFIKSVPGVIIGLSDKGDVIEFNPEAEKVFNRKREEVIGQNYFNLFVAESARKSLELNMKRLFSGDIPGNLISEVNTSSGIELNIEWTAHKLVDDSDQLTGIIGIGINILLP
ncbi:MAG: PAS domain-containing protein, partial [Lentimicrobium sp.]|nr:PAS domain-containing protein [Lentimicrobium sp.]